MAEYAVRYNKEQNAYYVAEVAGEEGDDLAATEVFSSLQEAERYQNGCQDGNIKFKSGYSPPPPPPSPRPIVPVKDVEAVQKVERSSFGLRSALFDELDAIRNGKSSPQQAKAVASIAAQIVDVVKMELELAKHARDNERRPEDALPRLPL